MQTGISRTAHAVDASWEDEDWRTLGLCGQKDPDLWFAVGALEHKVAKSICQRCPVRTECLRYALEEPVDHGIWGGLTERERRRLRRQVARSEWLLGT